MGSPVSAPVANLYMEAFEERVLSLPPAQPKVWKRFVDDVFGITKRSNVQPLPAHLTTFVLPSKKSKTGAFLSWISWSTDQTKC